MEQLNWSAIRAEAELRYSDWFPERQIYFRSKGIVRFVSLSPRFQFMSMSVAFITTCWIGIASANLIFGNELIERKEQQIADLREIRADLHGQLMELEGDILTRAEALQARQQLIDQMLDRSDTLLGRMSVPDDGDAEQLETLPSGSPLPVGGPAAPTLMDDEADNNGQPADDDKALGDKALDDKVSQLETMQGQLMARLHTDIEQNIERFQSIISTAGIDINEIDSTADTANQGGPLTPLEGNEVTSGTDLELAELLEKSKRLNTLEGILESVPLTKPVDHYYISSNFGRRRDPFSKRWASHSGVDMASRWKTPVEVTAPGAVTFVGRNGPYGRMVEVDHGNGFSTRYGHLAKAVVKKGEQVALGDRIGLMGSTGRSTGTHLHYEIRFNDKPVNPLKFFEAAKYVQATE